MDISSSQGGEEVGEGARIPVHVEVCLRATSTARHGDIEASVAQYLEEHTVEFVDGTVVLDDAFLREHTEKVRVAGCAEAAERAQEQEQEQGRLGGQVPRSEGTGGGVSFFDADLFIHVFQLSDEGPSDEAVGGEEGGGGDTSACTQWVLPAVEFDGLWDKCVLLLSPTRCCCCCCGGCC